MEIVDIAYAVQSFRPELQQRHVHSMWRVAFWKSWRQMDKPLTRGQSLPHWFTDSLRHFTHTDVFLYFAVGSKFVDPHTLRFHSSGIDCLRKCLVECAKTGNVGVMRRIRDSVCLDKGEYRDALLAAAAHGKVDALEFLRSEAGVSTSDFRTECAYLTRAACSGGHLEVVRYLHCTAGLGAAEFRAQNNAACRAACNGGHLPTVEYLHRDVGLTADDFRAESNAACRNACTRGDEPILRYLHQSIGLTKDDFRALNGAPCMLACRAGALAAVKYLHTTVGFEGPDFTCSGACAAAVELSHLPVIEYLHRMVGLGTDDFREGGRMINGERRRPCEEAVEKGNIEVLTYLHREIGLGVEDFESGPLANNSSLATIKYLREQIGVHVDNIAFALTGTSSVDALEYLHANGFPVNELELRSDECWTLPLPVVQWLREHSRLLPSLIVQDSWTVCTNGRVEALQYLYPWLEPDVLREFGNVAAGNACIFGHAAAVRFLHSEAKLTRDDFVEGIRTSCHYWSETGIFSPLPRRITRDVLEYLHREVGISKRDFEDLHCFLKSTAGVLLDDLPEAIEYLRAAVGLDSQHLRIWARKAVQHCDLPLIKYLHQSFHLAPADFPLSDLRTRGTGQTVTRELLEYLHARVGCSAGDFRAEGLLMRVYNGAQDWASVMGYLHRDVGLGAQDFIEGLAWHGAACRAGRREILEYIYYSVQLTHGDYYNEVCELAASSLDVGFVRFLHRDVGLPVEVFCGEVCNAVAAATVNPNGNGRAVLEYLHRVIGVPGEAFRSTDDWALVAACLAGDVDVLQYLHHAVGLTADDFRGHGYSAVTAACVRGGLETVRYLHRSVGLTVGDFRAAVERPHLPLKYLDVMRYLYYDVGMPMQDFRAGDGGALRMAYREGAVDVLRFLHREAALPRADFVNVPIVELAGMPEGAARAFVEYLHREVGLPGKSFDTLWSEDILLTVLKYLHRAGGLTAADFADGMLAALACSAGRLDVVVFLHRDVGLGVSGFDGPACVEALVSDEHSVVRYLHGKVGVPVKSFFAVSSKELREQYEEQSISFTYLAEKGTIPPWPEQKRRRRL